MKMLALMKYGDRAASTRQRLLQFRPYLVDCDIEFINEPLLNNDYLDATFQGRRASLKAIVKSYLHRFWMLFGLRKFDLIWIQYEMFPYLPGWFEKLVFWSNKPVVVDYDDAIFHQYDQRVLLQNKLKPLIKGSALTVCGNQYLQDYVNQLNESTIIVPTVVDIQDYTPSSAVKGEAEPLVIGWIGSPSTWKFLRPMMPLLSRLAGELGLDIYVVGSNAKEQFPGVKFFDWLEDLEVDMIRKMDIGIMPLPDEPWARGKCGYKLIQYMACGIPVVASPVGVNVNIVDQDLDGYLATTESEWDQAIRKLVSDKTMRKQMGERARQKIVSKYSLQVHGPRLSKALKAIKSHELK